MFNRNLFSQLKFQEGRVLAALAAMKSCMLSPTPMNVDVVSLKRNFPVMFDFYSSWARLKKSEVEAIQRPDAVSCKSRLACFYLSHQCFIHLQAQRLLFREGRLLAGRLRVRGAAKMDLGEELPDAGL